MSHKKYWDTLVGSSSIRLLSTLSLCWEAETYDKEEQRISRYGLVDVETNHQINTIHPTSTLLTSAAPDEVLGVASECIRLCSEVCLTSTTACVKSAEFVFSGSCVGLGVGATSCGVEATGASSDLFPAVRGVLTWGPLEAALPGGGLLEAPELSWGFLSVWENRN